MHIILDGSSLAYRAWFASPNYGFKDVEDSEEEAQAIKEVFVIAFCSMLLRIVKTIDATGVDFSKLYICWDGRESLKLRRSIYPPYKVSRQKDRDKREFINPFYFIELIKDELKKVHPRFSIVFDCAEADDLIGVLCEHFGDEKKCIVTRDRDMFQLVDENTIFFDHHTEKFFEEKDVISEIGVSPDKIVAFKSIVGDPSDNYPGIKGVGPKKGKQLLEVGNLGMSDWVDEVDIFAKLAKIPFHLLEGSEVFDKMKPFATNYCFAPDWSALNLDRRFTKPLNLIV